MDAPKRISPDDIKDLVRRYAEQEYPGREWHAAMEIWLGELGEREECERLIIRPELTPPRPDASTPPGA